MLSLLSSGKRSSLSSAPTPKVHSGVGYGRAQSKESLSSVISSVSNVDEKKNSLVVAQRKKTSIVSSLKTRILSWTTASSSAAGLSSSKSKDLHSSMSTSSTAQPVLGVSLPTKSNATVNILNMERAEEVDEAEEPNEYEMQIIDNVASYYEKQVAIDDDMIDSANKSFPIFVGRSTPRLRLKAYLVRIAKYLNVWGMRKKINTVYKNTLETDETRIGIQSLSIGIRAIISSTCLYEKVLDRTGNSFILTLQNVHRTVLICAMMAVKMVEDRTLKNSTIANIGGISIEETGVLESQLCSLLKFELFISEELFTKNYLLLTNRVERI